MPSSTSTHTLPGAVAVDVAFSYTEAAAVTGVSADTVERDRKAGKYPNAFQDPSRRNTWRVPAADLVAAGRLDAGLVGQAEQELASLRESRELRELRGQVIRLEEQLRAQLQLTESLAADKVAHQRLIDALVRKVA